MDLNRIALWFAVLPALTLFWRSVRAPRRAISWLIVSSLVLLTAGAGWFLFRDSAGLVSASLMVALAFIPSWVSNAAARAGERQLFGRARVLSGFAALLHPVAEWRATPRIFHAFELAQAGQVADAEARLQVLARENNDIAPIAAAQRLRILGRWRELKGLCEREGLLVLRTRPALLALYLRALGELGFVDDLAKFMLAQETALTTTGARDLATLYLFAFTGQVEPTRQLLAAKSQRYPADTRDFWLAVATQSAGRPEDARRSFGALRASKDAQIRARAEERFIALAHESPEEPPSTQTLVIVQHFARALSDRQQFALESFGKRTPSRLTVALIVINVAVYLFGSFPLFIETRDGFANRWDFFAPDILTGDWWRTFSYMFVHANALHLVMNMGGLWVLGPFVERAFGRLRFAVIYFAAGFLGSGIYLLLSLFHWEVLQLVGASGCIMGLLGANAAVMLRTWIRQRAPVARQTFLRLVLVVVVQVVFDHTTPQVAGLAHAVGLLGGFLSALLLTDTISAPRQTPTRT